MLSSNIAFEVPVLVVGAGPVGATMALLLARHAVPSLLAERRSEPTRHPSGHVINARSMEIWREIAPSMALQITEMSAAIDDVRYVHWCTSLSGRQLGHCLAAPESEEELRALARLSPERPVHFPQHRLERVLWERCKSEPSVDFRTQCAWIGCQPDADGVVSELKPVDGGAPFRVRSRFLVAADGARSAIRSAHGIAMPGPVLQNVVSIHFQANLQRFVRGREGVLFWVYNRDVVGTLVHHMDDDWVLMVPYQPPQQSLSDFSRGRCTALLHAAIGSRAVDVSVKSIGTWAMTNQVAERYRAGNVLLVGDAAHRFPPTGGFGTNTGVQDAHNLAWKIRAVLAGAAHDAILDSYEDERKPVARHNADRSAHNFHNMNAVNRLVGLGAKDAHALSRLAHASWFRALPSRVQASSISVLWRAALKRLAVLEQDDTRARRVRAQLVTAIAAQRDHFFARGQEMGFHYDRGVVIHEASPKPVLGDGVRDYRPTTWPGCRIPHAELRRGPHALSTLDLARPDALVLIVDHDYARPWRNALATLQNTYRFPLELAEITSRSDVDDAFVDVHGEWQRAREVDATGAVLVRPDGHVAWRALTAPVDPRSALAAAYGRLVGPWSAARSPSDHGPAAWQDPQC